MRGYIRATFSAPGTDLHEEAASASFLIASLAHNPGLLRTYAAHMKRWSDRVANDGIDAVTAQVLRLAADGLWLNEALGLQPLAPDERRKLVSAMVEIAQQAAKQGRPTK